MIRADPGFPEHVRTLDVRLVAHLGLRPGCLSLGSSPETMSKSMASETPEEVT